MSDGRVPLAPGCEPTASAAQEGVFAESHPSRGEDAGYEAYYEHVQAGEAIEAFAQAANTQTLLSELTRAKALFQARMIALEMGIPLPTRLDNRADQSGLDDGPPLPGFEPRKKPPAKTADELKVIRGKAWATRKAPA